MRAARHEDINLITLLIGSSEAGLEILARDGSWVPVTSIPGTIVVNVGDMMKRLTNHLLPSTPHRVVNPPGEAAARSRYSIPFFMHPNPDYVIETLPQCITPDTTVDLRRFAVSNRLDKRLKFVIECVSLWKRELLNVHARDQGVRIVALSSDHGDAMIDEIDRRVAIPLKESDFAFVLD